MQKPNSIEAITALANRSEALARGKSYEITPGLKVLSKGATHKVFIHSVCTTRSKQRHR